MDMIFGEYIPKEAVENGFDMLDSRIPDWESRIDWDELDLSDSSKCIAGQLYPGSLYTEATKLLGMDVYEDPCRFGIDSFRGQDIHWNELNHLWRETHEARMGI